MKGLNVSISNPDWKMKNFQMREALFERTSSSIPIKRLLHRFQPLLYYILIPERHIAVRMKVVAFCDELFQLVAVFPEADSEASEKSGSEGGHVGLPRPQDAFANQARGQLDNERVFRNAAVAHQPLDVSADL